MVDWVIVCGASVAYERTTAIHASAKMQLSTSNARENHARLVYNLELSILLVP